MARADLNIKIGLVLQGFDKQIDSALKSLNSFAAKASKLGAELSIGVTAPIALLGQQSLSAAVEFDRLGQALNSITGNAQESARQLSNIRALAELPGISFEQAVKTTLQLQGLGFSAEKAEETIRQVGNVIAATGGTQANFEGVIRQLAQIEGKNKVLQEDIRILIENAPKLGKILKDTFGGATAEAIRDAGYNGEQFVDTLLLQLGQLPRVQGSLANSFENLGIAAKFALAQIGQEANRVFKVKELFDTLGGALNRASDVFKELDDNTKRAILRFVAIAAAIGPAIFAVGKLASAFSILGGANRAFVGAAAQAITSLVGFTSGMKISTAAAAGLNTALKFSFAGIAIAAFAAIAIQIYKFYSAIKASNAAIEDRISVTGAFIDVENKAREEVTAGLAVANELVAVAQDETRAQGERIAAIKRLKSEYPDYFGNVSEDLSQTGKLTAAKKNLADALLNEARARAAGAKITELATKQLELSDENAKKEAERLKIQQQLSEQGFASVDAAIAQLDANRENIAAQSQYGKEVNASQLSQAKNLAEIIGQYQRLGIEIDKNNGQVSDLEGAIKALAVEAARVSINTTPARTDSPTGSGAGASEAAKAQEKAIKAYQAALKEIEALDAATVRLGGSTDDNIIKKSKIAINALQGLYEAGFSETGKRAEVLIGIIKETRSAFDDFDTIGTLNLIPDQLVSDNAFKQLEDTKAILKGLRENSTAWLDELSKAQNEENLTTLKETLDGINTVIEPLRTSFEDFFTTVFEGGKNAFASFAESLKKAFAQLVSQILATIAVAAILSILLSTILPGFGAGGLKILGKIKDGGSLFGGLLKNLGGIPFLAEGGVVTGPTLAVVGESGPEAVIPLSKINQYTESGTTVIGGQFTIRGTDLVLAVERNQTQRGRSRGV